MSTQSSVILDPESCIPMWRGYSVYCLAVPACPTVKHHFTKPSVLIRGCGDPPCFCEHPHPRFLSQKEEPCDIHEQLRACAKNKDLPGGTLTHADILRRDSVQSCRNALDTMYAKCGALANAKELLRVHTSRNVSSWTSLIAEYVQRGQGRDALNCFENMQLVGISPNAVTLACVLKACGTMGATEKGEQIHNEIARQGLLENDLVLGTALVDMYAKCGALAKARQVLEELPSRNVFTWSALITGYAKHGQGEKALTCLEQMQQEGLTPNEVTFTCILKACGSIGAVSKGEKIHDEIVRQGLLKNNLVLGTALVDMYAKCGALEKARLLFAELPSRNVVTWSVLIAAYSQQCQEQQALNCFEQMQNEGLSPSGVTYACILKACGSLGAVDKGEQIHDEISRQGLLRNDSVLGTALVDMYAKCGALEKAQQVLNELPSRNVSTWNALMSGYAQQGHGAQALNCFELMQREGLSPNAITFTCLLNVCGHLGHVDDCYTYFLGMSSKYGVKPELEHYNCVVDLLGRAGHLDWAVRLIQEMPSYDHAAILAALLDACQKWGDVKVARWAFEHALQVDNTDAGVYVLMANIYAAAGMHKDAENVYAMRMENKSWHIV